MTVQQMFDKMQVHFPTVARSLVKEVFLQVLSLSLTDFYLKAQTTITDSQEALVLKALRRLEQEEPMAYIVGHKNFFGLDFFVGPGVLIPRFATEVLVAEVVDWIYVHKDSFMTSGGDYRQLKILDFGCGSGCIALSLLHTFPGAKALAIDTSEKALSYAEKNAAALGLSDRVTLLQQAVGDYTPREEVSVVVMNPPYIDIADIQAQRVEPSVHKFEPHEALFSGHEGLEDIRLWVEKGQRCLSPSPSLMAVEHGAGQGQRVMDLAKGCSNIFKYWSKKDYDGFDRHCFMERC